jgi:short-subunit dehydrogenase
MKLTGKVAVVTGGSMGIGEAIAKLFADEGASVVITSRDSARAEAARARIGNTERTLAVAADVRRRADLESLMATTLQRFGRVDAWVNNAGFGVIASVEEMAMRDCRDLFDTNFFGVIDAMQVAIPVMKRQGSGAIINISSVSGHITSPHMSAYSASKFALNSLSYAARLELHGTGVNVISVCPGYISTDFGANAVRSLGAMRVGRSAKLSVPADVVARAVLRAWRAGKRQAIVPWWYWLFVKLYENAPTLVENSLRRSLAPAEQVIAERQAARR